MKKINTFTHTYLEPHQVNSFVYCKRRWYYVNRLKLHLDNEHLEIGKYVAEHHWLDTEKRHELYLVSHILMMKSKVDYLTEENGVQIPIEIKKRKCNASKPFKNDVAQLMCEVLLLEEHFSIQYSYGYLLYVGSKRKYKVMINLVNRRTIKSTLAEIRSYLKSVKIPPRTKNKNKCRGCSFELYCLCE